MVEWVGLENRSTGNCTVGSNPTLFARSRTPECTEHPAFCLCASPSEGSPSGAAAASAFIPAAVCAGRVPGLRPGQAHRPGGLCSALAAWRSQRVSDSAPPTSREATGRSRACLFSGPAWPPAGSGHGRHAAGEAHPRKTSRPHWPPEWRVALLEPRPGKQGRRDAGMQVGGIARVKNREQPGGSAPQAGFLKQFTLGALGRVSPTSAIPPGNAQRLVSVRRISETRPSRITTASTASSGVT